MTEAPERIWTPKNGQLIIPGGVQRWPSDVQYIRADHVCCLIAAAYVDAANLHQSLWRETSAYKTDQILKRTPNDARTALEALLKAEREKALRAENERLRAIALDYRHILHSAKTGRDLYCGTYVAKEYHFTRDQIDAALLKIEQALKGA